MTDPTVYDRAGNKIQLTEIIKGGGEGTVYKIQGNNSQCAKLYNPKKISEDAELAELHEKIMIMVDNPPYDRTWENSKRRSLAWPNSVLYNSFNKNKFIGFTMPLIDLRVYKEVHRYYDTDDRLKTLGGRFTWRHLFTAAYNIAISVAAVHDKGYCIGDIQQSNILIADDTLITLIDCDSFQIKNQIKGKIFYCQVGLPEYLPPELQNVDLRKKDYDRYYSDLFGLGIIIFQLLMNGTHPYSAKGKLVENASTQRMKIMNGYFPYVSKYQKTGDIKPPDNAPPFEIIPPPIQELFMKCFVDGHKEREKRPTAKEWVNALLREIQ